MFGKDWTTCSKYANHFSSHNEHVWGDEHNQCFIDKHENLHFLDEQEIDKTFKDYEANDSMHNLNKLFIFH